MGSNPIQIFDRTVNVLERSMNVRSRKHETLISNIANADTPNYKPFSLEVEKAMNPEPKAGMIRLRKTNESHLNASGASPDAIYTKRLDRSKQMTLRGDGNAVDIDHEMAQIAKNNLMYKASAQMLSTKFKGLKNVITGGTK